jgi:hypothetical protein
VDSIHFYIYLAEDARGAAGGAGGVGEVVGLEDGGVEGAVQQQVRHGCRTSASSSLLELSLVEGKFFAFQLPGGAEDTVRVGQ